MYHFKVRARTACGSGPFSAEIVVRFDTVPGQMQKVTTSSRDCQLIINWTPPTDGGSPIIRYQIEARTNNRWNYEVIKNCGGSSFERSCTVPMTTLTSAPFNLREGDLIAIRASAYN